MKQTKPRLQEDDDARKDKLTPTQLKKLVKDICHSSEVEEEENRATALLILIDELELEGLGGSTTCEIAKRAAFTFCMSDCLGAQIQLVRGEYEYD